MEWLVEARAVNQRQSVRLYSFVDKYENQIKDFTADLQTLIAIAFSLWRAVFLSDKTGKSEHTHSDAVGFLVEMLENNAINYSQDKKARNWTFNYYMANARYRLNEYADDYSGIQGIQRLPKFVQRGSKAKAKFRWMALHDAFKEAVDHFESRLKKAARN